jgi:hypothetical protein
MADIYKHRKIGIRCYDNGGETADRYTVLYTGRYRHLTAGEYWHRCMSDHPMHPQGVGMLGFDRNYIDNRSWGQRGGYKHLGKPIKFEDLPPDVQKLVTLDCFHLAVDHAGA